MNKRNSLMYNFRIAVGITMLALLLSGCANAATLAEASKVTDATISTEHIQSQISPAIINAPYGAGFYDTSEYMIGSSIVEMIFLQNNNSLYPNIGNWTKEEEIAAAKDIIAATNWWKNQDPKAKLSYIFDIHYDVPNIYNNGISELSYKGAMDFLGYNKYPNVTDNIYDYLNVMRSRYKTDWGFIVFVLKNKGPTYIRSSASKGGPDIVLWYNTNFNSKDTDITIDAKHEIGHTFYATDEYGWKWGDYSVEYSGYLNASQNVKSGCIMDTNGDCVSDGTKQQIGWRDSGNKGIFDIIYFFPNTMLSRNQNNNPTNVLTYSGRTTTINTYPNKNPYTELAVISRHNITNRHNITINKIWTVQYRIDGGADISATPIDGAFDNNDEYFTFTTPQLSSNVHKIEVYACNTAYMCSYNSETVDLRPRGSITGRVAVN